MILSQVSEEWDWRLGCRVLCRQPLVVQEDGRMRGMAESRRRWESLQIRSTLWVFDVAALQLGSVDLAARLVGHLVLGSTRLSQIAEHLAWWTARRLTDRRYIWKIEC